MEHVKNENEELRAQIEMIGIDKEGGTKRLEESLAILKTEQLVS